ncbi:putative DNA processing DprA domain protein [Neorickettsia helminthoeca str. Oregon]|uniref:Putative DNA processing DprA domain protein n=1 Tax=Neorickettsia helminthoeca str. Oregon TaxID=1286528 RepID=X5GW72_9RICK|nr:hypothetical protein [Neorickettsia helminthoeca]AHX11322.1 putative DNA processing DprA domain protein [Neorickettsia helminthoeca str. Oregon]
MQLSRTVGEITFYSMLKLRKTTENALIQVSTLQKRTSKKINSPTKTAILKEIEAVEDFDGTIIVSCEEKYSSKLRRIRDAPPIIATKGNVELLKTQHRNNRLEECNNK